MKPALAFAALALYVVFLSTLEPETGRWFALGLLGVFVAWPAVWRR